ncbi:unnamed protein product, partial [Pocillopora meandrina]
MPESSSLPANNSHGKNDSNLKHSTFERKDEMVPLTEKEIRSLTIPALKDELAKRNLSKKGNKQTLVSRLKANSSRQILPNLTFNCELTKLQDENNALKQRLHDVEDPYYSL